MFFTVSLFTIHTAELSLFNRWAHLFLGCPRSPVGGHRPFKLNIIHLEQ